MSEIKKKSDCRYTFFVTARKLPILILAAGAFASASGQTTLNLVADQKTRTSSFTYFANGLIKTETIEPDGAADLYLKTEYLYDAKGNRTSTTTTGSNGSATISRVGTADFATNGINPTGLYVTTVTNGAGEQEKREYHPMWGGLTKLVGPNGIATRWEYDEFGRKRFERRGYANATTTTYTDFTQWDYLASAQVVQGAAATYSVTAQVFSSAGTKIAPKVVVYYDKLNREIRSETESIKSGVVTAVYKDTVYDSLGRVLKVSLPYFQGDAQQWTTFAYDDLGRKTSETAPTGLVTTVSYSVLTTTTTVNAATADGGGRSRSEIRNALDRTIEVRDELNNPTYFVHDAKGNLTHTMDPHGNTTVLGYDLRGRKKTMSDRDMGSWSYVYNAFGELIQQTDAKGQVTTLSYDNTLGRLTQRTEPDLTTQFTYGSAAPNIGKLVQSSTNNGYCRTHAYDSLGRPQTTTVRTGGTTPCTAPTDATLSTSVAYDSAGRVDTLTYPSGVKLKNGYNATLGFLEQVANYTGNATGAVYWRWQNNDALGRVTGYLYGNNVATLKAFDAAMGGLKTLQAGSGGVATLANVQNAQYNYDSINRLSLRADRFDIPNLVEKVVYDKLNRLTQYGLYDSAGNTAIAPPTTLSYNALGNIKTKSDVGAYSYNLSGASSVRPHAAVTVRGALNNDYGYDVNGNMISGGGRTLSYTSFNMLSEVDNGSTCHKFVYQGEHQRVSQAIYGLPCSSVVAGSTATSKTLYLHPDAANGLSFEREVRGASTLYKHYINAGGQAVAVLTTTSLGITSNTAGTVNYLHYDHLGSVVAVTNSSGGVIERRSFDPWGRPRNTSGTPGSGELPNGVNAATDRGFTMHEHLEGVGLVHMNGRVYDPTLARFTSADPIVQSPSNGQSYNRYAYVWNDPLNGSDPTGYFNPLREIRNAWKGIWHSKIGRVAVVVAVAYATGYWSGEGLAATGSETFVTTTVAADGAITTTLTPLSNVIVGAAGGFAGSYVGSNGDLKAGLQGAATGAAFAYVGGFEGGTAIAIGHAAVGCASAAVSGGNCGRGAASALVAHYTTTDLANGIQDPVAKGIIVTVSGGITSKISGGTFENGAVTAAYGYLFNHCMHAADCWREAQEGFTRAVRSVFVDPFVRLSEWIQSNPGETALAVASVTPVGVPARVVQVGGRAVEIASGIVTESQFLRNALDYLGKGYAEAGAGRWLSADGLRQVRFGAHEVRNPTNLHGHFEAYDKAGGRVVENAVVKIVKDGP